MNFNGFRRILKNLWGRMYIAYTRYFVERLLIRSSIEKIYLLLGGHIFFETLSAAVRLDLFSLLSKHGGLTRSQIGTLLGISEKPARILLLGCTSVGLLRKSGEIYYNSYLAERLLTRNNPDNIIPIIEWQHFINYPAMYHFYDALKANTNTGLEEFDGKENTLYGRLTHHPQLERIFQDAMEAISVQANAMLARYVDLSHVKHLVDVGGGNGTNIIALAQRYSGLRATVFDSPSVCEIARKNITGAGLANRLDTFPGDCFLDEFPRDVDCFLFAHFFTIWSEEKNQLLLKKSYQALPPGGSVIVFNMMQSGRENGPLSAAMGSPYFLTLATGEGMLYTWNEYETWMKEAGFATVKKQVLPRDHGAVIGIKG